MKTVKCKPQSTSSTGYVLLMVLFLGAISAIALGSAVTRTIHTATLNERNNYYTVNLSAAEAATEKVIARIMVDYQQGGEAQVYSKINQYADLIPDGDTYWDQFVFSNGQEDERRTYVERISNPDYVRLESQFFGLYGRASTYRVLSNARQNTGRYPAVVGAVQQDIQIASIPVFQFAIFYNGLLELTRTRDIVVNGRIHANGDIFLGSEWPIVFNAPVTASGTIQMKTWGDFTLGVSVGPITYAGIPDYRTNVAQLSFPVGTNNTRTAMHKIIDIPPSGENVNSAMGKERFYNKASMALLVNDATVTVIIKRPGSDVNLVKWETNNVTSALTNLFPFVTTTNIFYDQREGEWMKTTQIDISVLKMWIGANSFVQAERLAGNPLNIIYVADLRPTTTAIRLIKGNTLPDEEDKGFTVATPNPLYVMGNYNVPSNTRVPAALVSDALTVLSASWDDSKSTGLAEDRIAISTTINAAIITGLVPSQGSDGTTPFSGGIMNFVRLLENWGTYDPSIVLTLNTSFVNLYDSVKATAPYRGGNNYYRAAKRQLLFDSNFTNSSKLPPGTPMLSALIRAKWASPPPNTVDYVGK